MFRAVVICFEMKGSECRNSKRARDTRRLVDFLVQSGADVLLWERVLREGNPPRIFWTPSRSVAHGKTTGLYAVQGFQLPVVGGAKDPVPIAARPSRMKLTIVILGFGGTGTSRGDRVRCGKPVAKNREEVDDVGLLLGAELEIADLAVRRDRGGRLSGRHSRDVLHVVEDLRRREEPGEAGRGAYTEVESYLLAAGVYGDVPLIVEMDDLLETLEDSIVHVSLHETWGRSSVHVAVTRCLEESTELEDVSRNVVEEPGPLGRRIVVGTQAIIDEASPKWVKPVGIECLVGLLVPGIKEILRDADIRIAVHGKRLFPLRVECYIG